MIVTTTNGTYIYSHVTHSITANQVMKATLKLLK
jgi:hypothetical protein